MESRHVGPAERLSSAARPAARARMRGVIYLRQMLKVQLRVDLRGADVGVSQELLDAAQVAAGFEQVRRKGVAKHMWVHVHPQALAARPRPYAQLHRPRAEPPAPPAEEHRCLVAIPGRGMLLHRGALDQPFSQSFDRKPADRQNPRLAAFAEDTHRTIG